MYRQLPCVQNISIVPPFRRKRTLQKISKFKGIVEERAHLARMKLRTQCRVVPVLLARLFFAVEELNSLRVHLRDDRGSS